jgi:hypothetical protein
VSRRIRNEEIDHYEVEEERYDDDHDDEASKSDTKSN